MQLVVFSVDTVEILNQKSDTDHGDNDSLHLVWTVTRITTKSSQKFCKTMRVGGVLHSGDVVKGPFTSGPIAIDDETVVMVNFTLTNLGSSDAEEQFKQAVQITKKIAPAVLGVVAGLSVEIISAGTAGAALTPGVIHQFALTLAVEVAGAVKSTISSVVNTLSDVFDFLNIHFGPPNCNGIIMKFTVEPGYISSNLQQAMNVSVPTDVVQGEQPEPRCGKPPHTRVTFSIRPCGLRTFAPPRFNGSFGHLHPEVHSLRSFVTAGVSTGPDCGE
jgi:hypothetical protein